MPKPKKILPGIYRYLTDIYRISIGYLYYSSRGVWVYYVYQGLAETMQCHLLHFSFFGLAVYLEGSGLEVLAKPFCFHGALSAKACPPNLQRPR